jgi:hypothetical protein
MRMIVGAYAALPSLHLGPQPKLDPLFFDGMREIPEIDGLEIPYWGESKDTLSFLNASDSRWTNVFTLIPGVMDALKQDPVFGIASNDAAGRKRAIDYCRQAHAALVQTNDRLGRRAFCAIEIHTAPQLGKPGVTSSSTEALLRSLDELRNWDWQGAELLIEHCDAFVPGQPPVKGFMTLDREIEAITGTHGPTPCGILINWARSAIEGRSTQTPADHIRKARAEGLLRGLIFSGTARSNPIYGDWSDSHAPFETEGSLLNLETARAAIEAAGGAEKLAVFGIKMQTLPGTMTVPERIAFIRRNVEFALQAARS